MDETFEYYLLKFSDELMREKFDSLLCGRLRKNSHLKDKLTSDALYK